VLRLTSFSFLAEALDVFISATIAARGRSSYLAIVGGKLNVWVDGCWSEPGETVMKLGDGPFVLTIP
jgi:hypothetical protein